MKPILKTLMLLAVMVLISNTICAAPTEPHKASQSRILAENIIRNSVPQSDTKDNTLSLKSKAFGGIRPRIVGGTDASAGDYPWMVALLIASQPDAYTAQYCGGSLIRKDLVLTAAHCVEFITDTNLIDVTVGAHNLSSVTAQDRISVSAIFVHPDYDNYNLDNDIAVLKLSRDTTQTPLSVIDTNLFAQISVGDPFTVIGWGTLFEQTTTQPAAYPDTLQEVQVPYVDNQVCNDALFDPNSGESLTKNQICAGLAGGGKDSCQGDSGGPLVYSNNGNWYLSGIVSWGFGCARPDSYGVYTKAANYADWAIHVADTLYVQSSYDFQYVGVTETNEWATLVSNFALDATVVLDISVSGDAAFSVGENHCLNISLNANDQCQFVLKFKPATAGKKSAVVSITENNGNSHTIGLVGIGLTPIEANAALDTKEWTWYSGVDAIWVEDQTSNSVNASSMRSGVITNEQSSHIQTYIEGPGTLSFRWKVSSEADYDYFDFIIDGKLVDYASGEIDWLFRSIQLEPGTHSIRWSYTKDFSVSGGMDAAWLDNVSYERQESKSSGTSSDSGQNNGAKDSGGGGSLAWFFLLAIAIGRPLVLTPRK